ncbi:Uncharacterised protein [Streptococcus pneumoniae]|nr:Uncharacterised protein [Streptococcus pneumoniae]CJB69982.1 Uncharacterised protein [Streptococcus pneumoniae]CJB75314.1 Uncharacterised protein [Streptococcus pneumoniae]CJC55826.1 Uncharacterised protein [Streptococcus pneumoniae]CJG80894.1 Uncharacterised protein [Streptococcus pneumoniae]
MMGHLGQTLHLLNQTFRVLKVQILKVQHSMYIPFGIIMRINQMVFG